jgi:hypothetical protein
MAAVDLVLRDRDIGCGRPTASVICRGVIRSVRRSPFRRAGGWSKVAATLAGVGLTVATAFAEEELVRVAIEAPPKVVWVGERFELDVKIAVAGELRQDGWPQLSAQKLDVPVQLEAPWIEAPPFGRALPWGSDPYKRDALELSFAREGGLALANWAATGTWVCKPGETGDFLSWTFLTYRREFVAERTGRFTLAAPRVRYATAASVQRDVFNDPVAVDTRLVTVEGESVELEVRALPEVGRPASFSGAIGRFAIGVEATRSELAVGDELELVLTIKGDRELDALAAPRLAEAEGWHLLGVLDETTTPSSEASERAPDRSPPRRVFRYHLRATSTSASRTPAIEFSYFAPGEGAYHTLTAEPIALRISANETPTAPEPRRSNRWPIAGGALVVLIVVLARKRRKRAELESRSPRAAGALAKFERELDRTDTDLAAAWTSFLGDELDVAETAISAHDLPKRLTDAGASPEVARKATHVLSQFVGARFGGAAPTIDTRELVERARELDAALRDASVRGGRA